MSNEQINSLKEKSTHGRDKLPAKLGYKSHDNRLREQLKTIS